MMRKARRVRSLVLRNYLAAAGVGFPVLALMIVLFGFDLEDKIFNYQVRLTADRLVAEFDTLTPSGSTNGVPMIYYIDQAEMPDWLRERIDPAWPITRPNGTIKGTYEISAGERGHFHLAVRQVGERKLYLLFNARPYVRSTAKIKTYLIIIAGVAGAALAVSLFFIYRMTKRLSEPLEKMAETFEDGDPLAASETLSDGGLVELATLVKAIQSRDRRIQSLVERERQFNRDASHELRTPLAVAMGAAEIMESSGASGSAFQRLTTSLDDMSRLTEGILWLGRDAACDESCSPLEVARDVIKASRHLLRNREVEMELRGDAAISIPVPQAVAQVMIGNLIRNAFNYTDEGKVSVSVAPGRVLVEDTGSGFGNVEQERTGFGIGLSLVERLCQHFGMRLKLSSARSEKGTRAEIAWGEG